MSAIERATAAWNGHLPTWVQKLAEACDATSQNQVANQIGYSPTYVSWVINNKCAERKIDETAVQQAVEGALMARIVNCPVLGEMRADICLKHQRAPYADTNHVRVRLYRACRNGCQNSRLED